jgi:hypothetical protein
VVSLLYLLLRRALAVAALRLRSREFKELEIVVLRHELAVLRRQISRPRLDERDRVFLAAAGQLLGRESRSFFVRPDTLLGWHRQLVRRRWTYAGRRRVDPQSRRRSMRSCCGSRVRTRAGATSGSSASSLVSGCASRQRRSPRSSGKPACPRPALAPSSAGASSCVPTPTRSSPATFSLSRRSGSDDSMCCSSSSSAAGASISQVAPRTRTGAGQPNKPGSSRGHSPNERHRPGS